MVEFQGMLSVMAQPSARTDSPSELDAGAARARRAAGGDREALEALLREHGPAIFKLCHHVAGPAEGPDAAQLAFERIVQRIDRYDADKGAFRSWALTVARNVCRDRLRRRGLERAAFAADGETMTAIAASAQPDPERVALARLDAGDLAVALETLPEKMRSAIVLFHVHESSYEQIATTLEVPLGTVMTWLHRGRKRLRAALEAR